MEETHDHATIPDHKVPLKEDFVVKSNNEGVGMSMSMNPEKIAVQFDREMEKRQIREEIIASEIIQRQELENEVRMELMIEKQILGMRNFYGFSNVDLPMLTKYGFLGSQYRPNYDEYLLNLGASDDKIRGEMKLINGPIDGSDEYLQVHPHPPENNVIGSEGMQHMEVEALGKWPFNRDPSYVAVHVAEKFNADLVEEVMAEATPSAGITGMKRKAETPARACDKETTPAMSMDSQKWFCSVCEVSTTSEVTLNAHFQGKKHKAKEARFRANDTTDTISMDRDTLRPVSTMSSEQEHSSVAMKWECSLCQLSASSEMHLRSHLHGRKHKAKEAKLQTVENTANIDEFPVEKSQEESVPSSNVNATETDKQWYCSLCEVSASSEKNLNEHLQGRKHRAKAGLPQQGIDNLSHESTEKVSEVEIVKEKSLDGGEILKHEQKTSNPNAGLSKDEEKELKETEYSSKDTSNVSDMKNDITEGNQQESGLGASQDTKELEKQGDCSMEFVKYWHCKICNKGTHDEATMAAHRKSNEHMTLLKKHGGGLISVASIPKDALKSGGSPREELSN